jgi:hypothetical protein
MCHTGAGGTCGPDGGVVMNNVLAFQRWMYGTSTRYTGTMGRLYGAYAYIFDLQRFCRGPDGSAHGSSKR